jgi:membrane protein
VSYQALFAIFAAIYLTFAISGLWLGGSTEAVDALIRVVNGYVPNLISENSEILTPEQAYDIASNMTGVLTITGVIALVAVVWTAIGWVTFSRRAVRDMFGLAPDRRSYLLLKARDLFAAAIFGISLIVGSALSYASAAVLTWLIELLEWGTGSDAVNLLIRIGSVVVSFGLLSAALAAMVRFLTGTSLRWRTIWPGALLGGGAMTLLQFGAGFLLSYTPTNPLLATFAIFVGLLLWFRINGVIMLVAAAWIAVAARDRDLPLLRQSEDERIAAEYQALLLAARIRLREAREAQKTAGWLRAWSARRAVRSAATELDELLADPPKITTPDAATAHRLLTELTRSRRDVRGAG